MVYGSSGGVLWKFPLSFEDSTAFGCITPPTQLLIEWMLNLY